MRSTLFDCDAVRSTSTVRSFDSRSIIERMWTIWATEHGLSVEAALALAHGRRTRETVRWSLSVPTISTLPHCDVLVRDLRAVRTEAPADGWTIRLVVDGPHDPKRRSTGHDSDTQHTLIQSLPARGNFA